MRFRPNATGWKLLMESGHDRHNLWTLALMALAVAASSGGMTHADDPPATASAPNRRQVIRTGADALLRRISVVAEVRYKRKGQPAATIRGQVIARSLDHIQLEGAGGAGISILRKDILRLDERGVFDADLPEPNNGGPMALACFALLAAGVPMDDAALASQLRTLQEHPLPGTYARGLRAAVLARQIERCGVPTERGRLRRLLNDDVRWLLNAMKADGYYTYDAQSTHKDNSVTQFANLGMWAAADVFSEVPGTYWRAVEEHWLSTQREDGGWVYDPTDKDSKPSMAIAGANSLYLVLDRRYPKLERPYVRFRGAIMSPRLRLRRAGLFAAIQRADDYLKTHPPDINDYMGYNLFGLERLGVASGRGRLGGQEWHSTHLPVVAERTWGNDAVADSFSLIYLVHGLAPIWVQKLAWGDDPDACHRYDRDLHFLTRHLNTTLESLWRWQIIEADTTVEGMLDAPLLYIAGESVPRLPAETWQTLRAYVRRGGTLFVHADRSSYAFSVDIRKRIERLFMADKLTFRELPPEHKLYRMHYGRTGEWADRPPLLALGDGTREFVIHSPVDIAGAWHQNLARRHPDLFGLMVNLHLYVKAGWRAQAATQPRADSDDGPGDS